MDKRWQRGEVDIGGLAILAVLIVVTIITAKTGTNTAITSPGVSSLPSNGSGYQIGGNNTQGSAPQSQYLAISPGNASYTYQPYEEYITIENYGSGPVNITGWQLKNGKDKRTYDVGGSLQRFSADVAVIPKAATYLSANGRNTLNDIVLGRGEMAIVTTGKVGVNSPYVIESFKENICSGYIEALPEYAFTPSLTRNCPQPRNEPGLSNLDSTCRRVVERISTCHTPQFDTRDQDGNICHNCVDGELLSGSCVAYIREHFSYQGCIANHLGDPNFSGRTWRIFLGRGWEMFAQDYETIELFNQSGQLVVSQNY